MNKHKWRRVDFGCLWAPPGPWDPIVTLEIYPENSRLRVFHNTVCTRGVMLKMLDKTWTVAHLKQTGKLRRNDECYVWLHGFSQLGIGKKREIIMSEKTFALLQHFFFSHTAAKDINLCSESGQTWVFWTSLKIYNSRNCLCHFLRHTLHKLYT